MDFFDEKILELRDNARKEKFSTLETGMYIKNEKVEFERMFLFEDKMSILLPTILVDMPSNLVRLKYLSELRPQIIKTTLDTTVNFTFSKYDLDLEEIQVKDAAKQSQKMLKQLNPAYIFYELEEKKLETTTISWFDFKSYAMDAQMYNMMYVTCINKKLVHGNFNCLYQDMIEWKEAVNQVISSIEDCTRKKG